MARRITHLIEEQDNKSNQLRAKDIAVEVEKTQEGLKKLSMQERRAPTPEVIREEVFHSNPLKYPQ
jgi:hypothetical protein